ncbi:tyrosine-type recombinase/integrase [Roseomonas sp. GCM10028921]
MGTAGGGQLTARTVATAKHPGSPARPIRRGDGGGLYLQISPGGGKSWLFRFMLAGKSREMGLGPVGEPPRGVTLAGARLAAAEAHQLLRAGLDPIEQRATAQRHAAAERERTAANTFQAVAEKMIDAREAGWRNAKHRWQWRATLATHAYPVLGTIPVAEISTDDVLHVLRPIWTKTPETASRLRGRIERVLAYAKARGLRQGENPATWRGHLSEALPSPRRIEGRTPRHHPALPWAEMPAFFADLRGREAMAARALEFAILTAARTGEVLGARWREIDLEGAVWTVPAERMKMKREHRVPLAPAALAVLKAVRPLATGPAAFVFPGQERAQTLSQMAMLMLLRRINQRGPEMPPRWRDGRTGQPIAVHGFRSTFRDWVGEASVHSTDLAEAALAHVVRNKVEAAYARGDLFTKRAALMADWATYCIGPAGAMLETQNASVARAPWMAAAIRNADRQVRPDGNDEDGSR